MPDDQYIEQDVRQSQNVVPDLTIGLAQVPDIEQQEHNWYDKVGQSDDLGLSYQGEDDHQRLGYSKGWCDD